MTYPRIDPAWHSEAATPGPARVAPASAGFDAALAGTADHLELTDGRRLALAVRRWHARADHEDRWLLARCRGPAVDLGCGPGRLVHALDDRGIPAIGVDLSPCAVRGCRARGVAVFQGDAFGWLPGAGGWRHVLLADGKHRHRRRPGHIAAPRRRAADTLRHCPGGDRTLGDGTLARRRPPGRYRRDRSVVSVGVARSSRAHRGGGRGGSRGRRYPTPSATLLRRTTPRRVMSDR